MNDDDDNIRGPSNKAERLAVAAQVAPVLRSQDPKVLNRRVARVDKNGNIVGYTTLGEVQHGILERAKIEIAPVEGKRPEIIFCEQCGKPIAPKTRNAQDNQRFCKKCKKDRNTAARRERLAKETDEQRADRLKKVRDGCRARRANETAAEREHRLATSHEWQSRETPEEREARLKRCREQHPPVASMTPAEREAARKRWRQNKRRTYKKKAK